MTRTARSDGSNLSTQQLDALRTKVNGKVVVKGETPNEEYRPLIERWNRLHVKESNIIVLPESEDDISTTIKFVAEHNLDVTISCGRHTYSGPSSGFGLVIDMRNMRKVTVDAEKKTAKAQGGCIAGDVEKAAESVGLRAVMGAVNATGVGGITTGGGVSNLSGQYGLVADNVVEARVALADGRIVVASETENPDLFWGIRGGGSNFGLVTEFTYKLHECDHEVYGGFLMFSPDKTAKVISMLSTLHSDSIMKSNGKFAATAFFGSMGGVLMPGFMVYYDGPEDEAKKWAKPLFDLEPLTPPSHCGMSPHTATTDWAQFEKLFPPQFNRILGTSTQMDYPIDEAVMTKAVNLYNEVISRHPENLAVSKLIIDLRDYSKIASVPLDATAYANRREGMLIAADFIWDDPALDEEVTAAAKDWMGKVRAMIKESNSQKGIADVGAHVAATTLYALITDGEEKLQAVFGPNLLKMKQVKAKYDPNMMWNKWYPVEPESTS
ncbi:hypothetical protein H072_1398 [Dactylellina haptotyla CBS 200.50]|uniref:FAD-binding PCMH-type domain-containing protein n=1 Tax=Dactylellina haptotyla (strain CBS 200.50) TaxID=1284197 RepID=S8ANU9_DACHA|nr:hypothetical protein H072_1398 [Dactylellina haptotyla CBS 200.50]